MTHIWESSCGSHLQCTLRRTLGKDFTAHRLHVFLHYIPIIRKSYCILFLVKNREASVTLTTKKKDSPRKNLREASFGFFVPSFEWPLPWTLRILQRTWINTMERNWAMLIKFKNIPRETAQQLRSHTILAEDPSWVPRSHNGRLTTVHDSCSRDPRPRLASALVCMYPHTVTHTYT